MNAIKNMPISVIILIGLCATSIAVFAIGFILNMSGLHKSAFYSTLSGYITLGLSMAMCIIAILYNNKDKQMKTNWAQVLTQVGPFGIMLLLSSFITYMAIKHKKNIIDGLVSNNYYVFSNITTLFTFFQLFILYQSSHNKIGMEMFSLNPLTVSLLYLCGTISMISFCLTYMILTYYTTDG